MLQMQHKQLGSWGCCKRNMCTRSNDAYAARQSRCDAKAAIGLGMLRMQQCYKCSKGLDTIAAKRMHADIAAIPAGVMLYMQYGDLGVAKPAICFGVSCCHCIIVSVLFRMFRAMTQSQQYPGAQVGIVQIQPHGYVTE